MSRLRGRSARSPSDASVDESVAGEKSSRRAANVYDAVAGILIAVQTLSFTDSSKDESRRPA